MTRSLSVLMILSSLLPATALAQVEGTPKKESRTESQKSERYREVDHIEFDETVIEATAKKPAGMWIGSRVDSAFEKFIPERSNFKADLAESLHKLDR